MNNKDGIAIIAEERKRQQEIGWTLEHDQEHKDSELANAAATYTMDPDVREGLISLMPETLFDNVPPTWPWDKEWWKPTPDDRIKELAKAGALIAAEIDRLLKIKESKS